MTAPAKSRALAKISAAHAKFREGEYLKTAMLLDDAAEILKAAGEWNNDKTCATIAALRSRMAEKAGPVEWTPETARQRIGGTFGT